MHVACIGGFGCQFCHPERSMVHHWTAASDSRLQLVPFFVRLLLDTFAPWGTARKYGDFYSPNWNRLVIKQYNRMG